MQPAWIGDLLAMARWQLPPIWLLYKSSIRCIFRNMWDETEWDSNRLSLALSLALCLQWPIVAQRFDLVSSLVYFTVIELHNNIIYGILYVIQSIMTNHPSYIVVVSKYSIPIKRIQTSDIRIFATVSLRCSWFDIFATHSYSCSTSFYFV